MTVWWRTSTIAPASLGAVIGVALFVAWHVWHWLAWVGIVVFGFLLMAAAGAETVWYALTG